MRCSLIITGVTLLASPVSADIIGFPIPQWDLNQWDSASPSPVSPPDSIALTTTTTGQSRSAFFTQRQDVSQFEVDFTYTSLAPHRARWGQLLCSKMWRPVMTRWHGFCLRGADQSRLLGSLGTFATGGGSLAVSLETSYFGAGSSGSGVYSDGRFGGGSSDTSPLAFSSGNPIDVTIRYDGALLGMTAHDTVSGALYEAPLIALDIPAMVGDNLAYVGFTGSTNSNSGTTQTLSNFHYRAIPARV